MKITIDHTVVEVSQGMTLMDAASSVGITVPALCHLKGVRNHPSCMVCLVKDVEKNRFLPACSYPVEEGLHIQTHSPEIREMRREALELLLSDHIGDCEAPCRRSCPAFMDIPRMNRLIVQNRMQEALDVVREEIALPWILGYICPAPCEKACHRGGIDKPVSICLLKRITGEETLQRQVVIPATRSGKRVAIIGTGPAGLSAAFYTLQAGHDCVLYDQHAEPGGMLRSHITEEQLPRQVLDAEIEVIRRMGAVFKMNTRISDATLEERLLHEYDALILATGSEEKKILDDFGLILEEEVIRVSRTTYGTRLPGIFACSNLTGRRQMAVRSVAKGKHAARSADHFLRTGKPHGEHKKFNSSFGRIVKEEFETYLLEAERTGRIEPAAGFRGGFSTEEAMAEAARCMHCDCRKVKECKLRHFADEYQAHQKRFEGPGRNLVTKEWQHRDVVYEPEKCIKCGICVEITKNEGELTGLTYIGRGFDVRIGVPFNEALESALTKTAIKVVRSCPTGALAMKRESSAFNPKLLTLLVFWFSLCLFNTAAVTSLFAQKNNSACWASFRGDPLLTGCTSASLTLPQRLLWTYKAGDAVKSSAVICGGSIYIGSDDGNVYCLSEKGDLKWKFQTGTSIEAAPLLARGTIYVGSLGGTLFALDSHTGKLKWKYATDGQISGSANWITDQAKKVTRILVGSYDFHLHCIDAASGKPLWKYETENYINGTVAIGHHLAIMGGCDGFLHLINTSTGKLTGKIDLGTYVPASAALNGSVAYAGNYDGEFFAVDIKTRKILWKSEGGGPFVASPAVSGGKVVTGAQNKQVYCFDAATGKLLWKYKSNGKVDASPVISGTMVVIASTDGRLRILDLASGAELWSYDMGSQIVGTPAIVSGLMVVGAADGTIYAFGPG